MEAFLSLVVWKLNWESVMTSSRPYLVRALLDWILDNDMTPHILVNARVNKVQVPQQYVNEDGQVVLNISPSAIKNYRQDNESMSFTCRFQGVEQDVFVPTAAVLGIYARETGQGMVFEEDYESVQDEDISESTPPSSTRPSGPPSLKVVK